MNGVGLRRYSEVHQQCPSGFHRPDDINKAVGGTDVSWAEKNSPRGIKPAGRTFKEPKLRTRPSGSATMHVNHDAARLEARRDFDLHGLRSGEILDRTVGHHELDFARSAARLIGNHELMDTVFDVLYLRGFLWAGCAPQIGYAESIDPDLAHVWDGCIRAIDEKGVDLAISSRCLGFEIVGLGVRRNKSVEVASGDTAVYGIQGISHSQQCAAIDVVLQRCGPRLIFVAVIRRIRVGHELHCDGVPARIEACEMLTTRDHHTIHVAVEYRELSAFAGVKRQERFS